MKKPFKRNNNEESYWKSFTDILAGLLLVILLILMLLLLLLTQMKEEEHLYDYPSEYRYDYLNDENGENNNESNHYKDHDYDNVGDSSGGGGGGGGDGVDDPGTNDNDGIYVDVGHDKTAVFVTVVDEETGNVIKKAGTLFELYANRNAKGGLLTLHTYYPIKTEYKQYETTEDGTFYLPEKITQGVYSLHNLVAPKGYGLAEDVSFEIKEARDWPEPFLVEVPMSPAKSIIYVHTVDADTNLNVPGCVYEVYAAEDIVTLDGTVRYKNGEKVDEFTCSETGNGQSIKLYLGKYTVIQKLTAQYYALNKDPVNVTLELEEGGEATTYTVRCQKTKAVFTLTDEFDKQPISGAVYTVAGREPLITDDNGQVTLTDLEKDTSYIVTLDSVPEPYRTTAQPVTLHVDGSGYIDGKTTQTLAHTAYQIRLTVDVRDIVFKNSVTGNTVRVYNSANVLVEEWEATGNAHEIVGLEPGLYTLEVDGNTSAQSTIDLKDNGKVQTLSTSIWTMWDTIAVAAAVVLLAMIIFLTIRLINRFRKRKKANG